MSKNISISLDEKTPYYQLEIIANNYCKVIAPASLANYRGEYIVTYHMDGLHSIKEPMATLEVMKLLLKIYEITECLEDFLFFQGDYELSLKNIFYNPKQGDYRIIIRKSWENHEQKDFTDLIEDLKLICTPESTSYLNDIRDFIQSFNPDKKQLLRYIDRKSQEIYQCDIG